MGDLQVQSVGLAGGMPVVEDDDPIPGLEIESVYIPGARGFADVKASIAAAATAESAAATAAGAALQAAAASRSAQRTAAKYIGSAMRIAHRGYSGHAIENTMSSFTRAVELGCDALELDVQISSDGVPVVIHDPTVDYSTTSTGNVKDFTAAQLQAMTRDARYGAFYASSRIPLFSEVLAFAKSKKIMIFPEIKGYRSPADIELMVQAVIDADYESMTKFQSFSLDDLTVARSFSATVALGHTNGADDYRTGAAALLSLGGPTPWIITSLYKAGLRPQYIAELQAMGIKVGVYTAYLASEFSRAEALGVDGVVCDRCFKAN